MDAQPIVIILVVLFMASVIVVSTIASIAMVRVMLAE